MKTCNNHCGEITVTWVHGDSCPLCASYDHQTTELGMLRTQALFIQAMHDLIEELSKRFTTEAFGNLREEIACVLARDYRRLLDCQQDRLINS